MKGFPYWPAKAMAFNQNQSMVDVRFFGKHDRLICNIINVGTGVNVWLNFQSVPADSGLHVVHIMVSCASTGKKAKRRRGGVHKRSGPAH
jgi:hypothetical protein